MSKKIIDKIADRIRGKGKGSVFIPKDFLDLGSRAAVDQTLRRLSRGWIPAMPIRRLGRGLYDYPRIHPQLGALSPDPDTLAATIAQKNGSKLLLSPSKAANLLGLSTQVPAQNVYLTDGPSRVVKVGNQVIRLKHAAPSKMALANSSKGIVVQALRALPRKSRTNNDVVKQIAGALPRNAKRDLTTRLPHAVPDWTRPLIKRISSE